MLLTAALAGALSACAATVRERIYKPEPMPAAPAWANQAPQEVSVTTSDGLLLRGYYWPPPTPDGELILFFHGQSGNRYAAARMAEPLAAQGAGLLVASYRGYGDNPGTPSEAGLHADGAAFLRLARQLAPSARIYPLGYSLGGAVALRLAAEEEVAGVVTLGAFSALADVAPSIVRGLLPDRFDNRAAIARIDESVLLLHGDRDEMVPLSNARALKAAAPDRVRLLTLEGAGHGADFNILAPIVLENIRQMPRRP